MSANLALVYLLMLFGSFMFDTVVKYVHFWITRKHFKEHHFVLGRYLLSLIFPFIVLGIMYFELGNSIIRMFLAAAVFGTLAEWVLGWWFHKIMGTRLWSYHLYPISRYTSFLAIPFWGLAGVFLWLVSKAIEL